MVSVGDAVCSGGGGGCCESGDAEPVAAEPASRRDSGSRQASWLELVSLRVAESAQFGGAMQLTTRNRTHTHNGHSPMRRRNSGASRRGRCRRRAAAVAAAGQAARKKQQQCGEEASERASELAAGHRPRDSSVDDRAKIDSLIAASCMPPPPLLPANPLPVCVRAASECLLSAASLGSAASCSVEFVRLPAP